MINLDLVSHRRYNALTGDWVLVSPHRTARPWQGLEEQSHATPGAYDPECYLCPGNARANGAVNPDYRGPFAFDNDFPALLTPAGPPASPHALFRSEPMSGRCRVVCYSHEHDRHLAAMNTGELAQVLSFLGEEFKALAALPEIAYVQVFENRGAMMGASNPHPHAQIWATNALPNEPEREMRQQARWLESRGMPLLMEYLDAELRESVRVICGNAGAVSLVPFWATWPFETMLLPRRHVTGPDQMTDDDWGDLADVLKQTLSALDGLFGTPMPYSMGWHASPSDAAPHPEWQFHIHIYPPLLRSATVRKHMVGFEMLGMPQRDLTPESAAQRLREVLEGSP